MPRYPKQDDPKGKKVIPSVTEIISDCTDSKGWAIPYGANMTVEWIRQNCKVDCGAYHEYVLKEQELNDARFNFRKVSQKALDVGSEVHNAIERYLLAVMKNKAKAGSLVLSNLTSFKPIVENLSKEARTAFGAFVQWAGDNNLKPISIEKTVYGNGWAGTLDFFGYLNGKLYVLDWKSSKALYPEMRYQIAAYRSETPRMKQIDQSDDKENWVETGCGILRLDKETGMPEFKDTSKSYEKDLSIFNAMVGLYFLRHPIIAKRAGR